MAKRRRTFLTSAKLMWPLALALAVLNAAGIYALVRDDAPEAPRVASIKAAPAPVAPAPPPPPEMIDPPAVADMLQSGTLIVISKKSQRMFVFSDGLPWASTPISTGKRRHETPSGVFPILQKRKFHRSNIYSNAPMPYMQRLTWDGIALHAGRVPGYPASHGCVRMPYQFAQSLFKLTSASATTVVIGDDPLDTEFDAQQFALTTTLPVRSALAPPPDPAKVIAVASAATEQMHHVLATMVSSSPPRTGLASGVPSAPQSTTPPRVTPAAPPAPAPATDSPAPSPRTMGGQTIQLTAAASQAEAEAHWARLLSTFPELSRFEKRVEPAIVKSRRVYRLRISGADAHRYCATLKSAGISCLNVS